ncbi:MAG: SLC13 family permease, partial [Gemmatimonadaceae bacterium]|nr:SLC13 family permease [Gemmatimonadaceae bacterium]
MMRPLAILAGLGVLAASVLLNPPQGLSASGAITLALLMVMALWWFTEALPVTATAMLPFVVLPLTGVATVGATAATYMSPIIFLVLGGALLALAIERCGLHRRIAVAVLRTSSGAARSLLLAFMVVTAFLSMWISNTATALIVMPIGLAVLAAVLPERRRGTAGAACLESSASGVRHGVGARHRLRCYGGRTRNPGRESDQRDRYGADRTKPGRPRELRRVDGVRRAAGAV